MAARIKYFIVISFLIFSVQVSAQLYRYENFGFCVGANIALGSHIQRIGINLNTYWFYDFVQINGGVRLYRNIKNLGPSGEYNEAVVSGGLVLSAGKKNKHHNPFINSYSNQTKRKFSFAYSYNAYFNKKQTSQQTGIVALQFDEFSLITENDILAKPFLDRFRTGAILLQYQHKNKFQAAINCTMWTGKMGSQVMNNSKFPNGYMDTTGGKYCNYSHGLLSAQLRVNLGYGQNLAMNAGVDAEQIRNFVQNKLIHDGLFHPGKKRKIINSHLPMLDSKGNQYLFLKDQKVRRPKPYLNMGTNYPDFY